jgi:hypothetical protein
VLADWIIDLAETTTTSRNSSVPGVAQRTGATIHLEIYPRAGIGIRHTSRCWR